MEQRCARHFPDLLVCESILKNACFAGAPEISGDYYALSTRVAEESGMGVLAVDYRTTASIPISPFPAALEDIIAAMKWLTDQGASKVTLHGDSSGGSCRHLSPAHNSQPTHTFGCDQLVNRRGIVRRHSGGRNADIYGAPSINWEGTGCDGGSCTYFQLLARPNFFDTNLLHSEVVYRRLRRHGRSG